MIVREARAEDAQAVTDLLNEVIEIGGTTAYETPRSLDDMASIIASADSRTFLHVAEAEGEILGFQWVSPDEEGMGIIATFARPGATQRGIGTALFARTRAACIAARYTLIDATIRADNAGGLAFYSKLGFRDHSVSKAVPLADGAPVDRVHKRMPL